MYNVFIQTQCLVKKYPTLGHKISNVENSHFDSVTFKVFALGVYTLMPVFLPQLEVFLEITF